MAPIPKGEQVARSCLVIGVMALLITERISNVPVSQSATTQAATTQATMTATHYGVSYHGSPMGCTGKPYSTYDPSIVAVGPSRYTQWPCGTVLLVHGPTGNSIQVIRQDSCPGCHHTLIDLSEAGSTIVCGKPSTCQVEVTVVEPQG